MTTNLTGSEKQISWANTIRTAAMERLTALRDDMLAALEREVATARQSAVENPDDPECATDIARAEAALAVGRDLQAILERQAVASWWIDNRADVSLSTGLAGATLLCSKLSRNDRFGIRHQ